MDASLSDFVLSVMLLLQLSITLSIQFTTCLLYSQYTPLHMFSSDVPMNTMYSGFTVISFVHLVGFMAAYCSSFCILSTNYRTAVNFARCTHDGSRPITEFTDIKNPFASGTPMVVLWHFPMTKRNTLKSTLPLWLIGFRACKIFFNSNHRSDPSKIHTRTSFLVSHRPSPLYSCIFDIGFGLSFLLVPVV